MDRFTQAYIACALWTGVDDPEIDNDNNYDMTLDDMAPETIAEMIADCADFQESNSALLESIDPEQAGHDFWLTRNGHGAGFWDRGLGEPGDMLTESCRPYGERFLYLGDDGRIYQS